MVYINLIYLMVYILPCDIYVVTFKFVDIFSVSTQFINKFSKWRRFIYVNNKDYNVSGGPKSG
jgi:hypothetical protein